MEVGGGRAPAERVRLIPFGDLDSRRPADGPWPGRLPAPHPPSRSPGGYPPNSPTPRTDRLGFSGRIALSAPPVRVAVEGHGEAAGVGGR
jgi:protein ImuB